MWCLNTPDSLRQSLSSRQNRGVWKEQDLLLQSKKCNYLNTARHHCLKLAKARQEKPGVITLYLSPSSGTTTVHSPRAYLISIFPCTLLQFLHNSKDILHIQVHTLSKDEMGLRDILLLSYWNIKPWKISQQSCSKTVEDESVVWNYPHRQWNWLRVFKCIRMNQF